MNILYIIPQKIAESEIYTPIPLIRISNYLNSRKEELDKNIREKLIDLRLEKLPKFIPEQFDFYKEKLSKLLNSIYTSFSFDIVAISCYGSHSYINSLVVANQIKFGISKSIQIIVGGHHPSFCPEDFQPSNIPKSLSIEENKTPFDFLIYGEGEKPFFNLIKELSYKEVKNNLSEDVKVIKPSLIRDLNSLPEIDFQLINKYKRSYLDGETMFLDFSRGCPYSCHFCANSSIPKEIKFIRMKSIDNSIRELGKCLEEGWKKIQISDPIFLVRRRSREKFFEHLRNFPYNFEYPRQIFIYDRIDNISNHDLINFQKYNLIPQFGLEAVSPTLLRRINKTSQPRKYINRFIEIVKFSNEIGLYPKFNMILNLPGTDRNCLRETRKYLFNQTDPLIKKYLINFNFSVYYNIPKTELYKSSRSRFGAEFFEEKWWKIFDSNQKIMSYLVRPSKSLSLEESLEEYYSIFKQIIRNQRNFDKSIHSNKSFYLVWGKINQIIKLSKKYEKSGVQRGKQPKLFSQPPI